MDEFYESRVEEVMASHLWDLPLVEKDAKIKFVMIILIGRGYVWVVDSMKNMRIEGVITEHDALKFFESYDDSLKAEDCMSRNVVVCEKNEKIKDVVKKIKEKGVRRLPVVENGKLIGEITLRHLIEKFFSLLS